MLSDSNGIAQRPATVRSRITNGKLGVDGRSREARRYRDLVEAFSRDLGHELSESESQLVRRAAAATVRAEQLETLMLRGEPIDDSALTRYHNAAMRALVTLRAQKKFKVGLPAQEPEKQTIDLSAYTDDELRQLRAMHTAAAERTS